MDSLEYPQDVDYEQELMEFRESASSFVPGQATKFRIDISNMCSRTYSGTRSVESFVAMATALIEDDFFKQLGIDVAALFIISIRTREVDLEVERELKLDADRVRRLGNNLMAMVKGLLDTQAITEGDCKRFLSTQLLADSKLISSKVIFDRRLIRLNTAKLYKQQKYNLMREEINGYSSLVNDLTSLSIDNERDDKGKLTPTPLTKIPEFLNIMTSRIGEFYLDPNRVLDIILTFLVEQISVNYKFWVELIKQSGWVEEHVTSDSETIKCSTILAQLIGFKFFNHHESLEPVPKQLYLAIAILLKNNVILLGDILPHLYPYPEMMVENAKEYETKMNKEITSNSGGKLGTYGALGEEGSTEKVKRVEAKEDVEEEVKVYPANDVVELLRALFSVGDLTHAELMWAQFDKLIELYPELVYDIYRMCHIVLQPAYDNYVSEKNKSLQAHFSEQSYQSKLKTALSTADDLNPTIPTEIKLKRVLVFDALLNDEQDLIKGERYVFFYKEWHDQIQTCKSPRDLITRLMPLMRMAGHKTYLAPDLVQKLVLIASGLLEREAEISDARNICKLMIREYLLPAISFSEGNPGTMASVWEILCRFSYQERYAMYDEWYNDFYKDDIECKLLKARTERSIKYVMRRVSKNDIRRCGRDLGKLAHSNPTIVFNVVLEQIQNFDNMAPLMADACRYLGDFCYDVLGYSLTGKWTGQQDRITFKPKEKEDGMPSNWLKALSVFTGMLYKKQDIDATPFLRYLAKQLRKDESVEDLILLNEFVTKIGGIEILGNACTDTQITAAGCADSLKMDAFLPIAPDNRRASRRVLNRLKESLRRNNVGFEIMVLLYRLQEVCQGERGLPASDRCTKLDKVHHSRLQYAELICSLFEGEEYASLVPSVDVLVKEYRLPLDVAMDMVRPVTQHKIAISLDTPLVENEVWSPIKELTDAVAGILTDPPAPSMFTPEFYVMFWQLSLYDIHYPEEAYEEAIKRHTDMIAQCQNPRSSYCLSNRDSVVKKAERQAQLSLEALSVDKPKHEAHVKKVRAALLDSCRRWFPSSMHRTDLVNNILQYCILPRSLRSEVDAVFCYEFSILMHKMNTKNFSSLTLFDKLLSEYLPPVLMSFTEYEATIQSRFLFKVLTQMAAWRRDKEAFYKETQGTNLIGFQKNWSSHPGNEVAKEDLLSFNDFLRVVWKWHNKLYLAIEQALTSDEAHMIKNSFLVLRQLLPCFPAATEHGEGITAIVNRISSEERRPNIKVLSQSYYGLVAKSKVRWVSKSKFMGFKEPAAPAAPLEIKIVPATVTPPPPPPPTTTTSTTTSSPSGTPKSTHDDRDKREERDTKREEREKRDDKDKREDRDSKRDDRREERDSKRDDRDSKRDDRESKRDDRDNKREDRDSKRDERDSKRDDRDKREERATKDESKSSRHTSSSRHASPSKRSDSKEVSLSSNGRKRSRESNYRESNTVESTRSKSPRLNDTSRHHSTTPTTTTTSRDSPRNSRDTPSTPRASSRGTKRSSDETVDRPEKRRDVRLDRREERPRIEDRLRIDDRRRVIDDRRVVDDRRVEDRRAADDRRVNDDRRRDRHHYNNNNRRR